MDWSKSWLRRRCISWAWHQQKEFPLHYILWVGVHCDCVRDGSATSTCFNLILAQTQQQLQQQIKTTWTTTKWDSASLKPPSKCASICFASSSSPFNPALSFLSQDVVLLSKNSVLLDGISDNLNWLTLICCRIYDNMRQNLRQQSAHLFSVLSKQLNDGAPG